MTDTTHVGTKKSTIVRANDTQLAVLRTAFGTLDRVSPRLAGRLAARVWCTLPRPNGRSRDDRPATGRLGSASARSAVTLPDGRRVATETWGDGPPIYLVHGWGGWRGQLGTFVAPLVERGHRVVAFDAPSHGESGPGRHGPRRTTGLEFMEALDAVVAGFGPPSGIVAHSLGSAMSALAISDGVPAPARLALVAPTVGPLPHITMMARMFGFSDRTQRAMIDRLEEMLGRPMSDFDTLKLSRPMPRTLIIHDRHDKEVPLAEGVQLAEAWPDVELVTTEGLGHRRILRDPGVVERVTGFVTASG